jgi:RHS repeat-associated protein
MSRKNTSPDLPGKIFFSPSSPCWQPQLTFSGNNNRIDGWLYDAAGNLLYDYIHHYTYDAENRVATIDSAAAYIYDAEGRRVAKLSSGGTVTASYVLGLGGEQVSEVNGAGAWMHSNVFVGGRLMATYEGPGEPKAGYHYHLTDWLGTQRMQTTASDNQEEICYSYPFGDGLSCTGTDATEHHFTGKERDAESGLDYFGARYLSSNLDRFLTPDWAGSPTAVPYASFGDPQSLNLYAYVRNDPNTGIDLDGHDYPGDGMTQYGTASSGFTQIWAGGFEEAAQQGINAIGAMDDYEESNSYTITTTTTVTVSLPPLPAPNDPAVTLILGGIVVDVKYTFGAMPNSPYQGGMDITATANNCAGCAWAQVFERTGSDTDGPRKDGEDIGPLYGDEGGGYSQFKDRPASSPGAVDTFSAVAILARANVTSKSFTAIGAMTYAYSIDGHGGVTMASAPRVSTTQERSQAIQVLQNHSPDWQIR